jgi:hypothetical protein
MDDKLIMIIRHAEKPVAGTVGINESGKEDNESLTVRGWQRAGALTRFFSAPPAPLQTPKAIVASAAIKQDGTGSRSLRPIQTITSLAQFLGIKPDTDHSKGQEGLAGKDICSQPSPVLVCWQHESIPELASAIVNSSQAIPDTWDDKDFASVWMLSFSGASGKWSFEVRQQGLLPGDKQ